MMKPQNLPMCLIYPFPAYPLPLFICTQNNPLIGSREAELAKATPRSKPQMHEAVQLIWQMKWHIK